MKKRFSSKQIETRRGMKSAQSNKANLHTQPLKQAQLNRRKKMNLDETKKCAMKLIKDMRLAAKKWGNVLLLVGFPEDSRVVCNGPRCFQKLEKMLLEGGTPVGMLSLKVIAGEEHFFCCVLDERANDDWAPPYLAAFIAKMAASKPGEIITVGMNAFKNQ
jgi:hypothetical protein